MNIAQAKKISIYHLLSFLGYHPSETRKSGNEVWYTSPFRKESEASFKIKMNQNIWYDFGEGEGGNILDFVMRYKSCNLKEALSFLETTQLEDTRPAFFISPVKEHLPDLFEGRSPEIIETKPIYNFALKDYFKQRCIASPIAYKYLQEIRYKVGNKEYFALCFPNRAGGFEVRSSVFKGCIGRKDISIIEGGSNKASIFEGYMDFLSCLSLFHKENLETDVIILNSVALKRKAIAFIRTKGYKEVLTYLDNDNSGQAALKTFREELEGVVITPCNHLYEYFNDLNDLLVQKTRQK